jgi:hypothetical protein
MMKSLLFSSVLVLSLAPAFASGQVSRSIKEAKVQKTVSIDIAAVAEFMPLAMEAAQIYMRAAEREEAHKLKLKAKGIAEVPPSHGERYVIDPGGMFASLGLSSFVLDHAGCLYIDKRFVTDEEMKTIIAIEKWLCRYLSPDVVEKIEKSKFSSSILPVFRGFENERYQKHDALIKKLTAEFNADKAVFCGGTRAQASMIGDLSPAIVKSHMIEESGGNDARSKAAWEVDPLQVNVPGDWGDEKKLVGLTKPQKRNEGNIETNVRAAIKYLSRKGFSTSAKLASTRKEWRFAGWKDALRRYNGRRDRADTNRYYSEEYADKIMKRALNPSCFVPIEIKLAK